MTSHCQWKVIMSSNKSVHIFGVKTKQKCFQAEGFFFILEMKCRRNALAK